MSTDTTTRTEFAHIVCTPGVMGGEPRIDGHRIRVRDIATARDQGGYSPEEIAASVYPGLSLAEVYAALAYFEDHRPQIEQAVAHEEQIVRQFQTEHPELIGSLRPKPE
jgi:uncharacterized protein (DUF433 family)